MNFWFNFGEIGLSIVKTSEYNHSSYQLIKKWPVLLIKKSLEGTNRPLQFDEGHLFKKVDKVSQTFS